MDHNFLDGRSLDLRWGRRGHLRQNIEALLVELGRASGED